MFTVVLLYFIVYKFKLIWLTKTDMWGSIIDIYKFQTAAYGIVALMLRPMQLYDTPTIVCNIYSFRVN